MQAIILAGGLGTRLKSVVANKPKVLSPVAGKPFLHYIITYLQNQGVEKYIFALGYLSEQVIDFLKDEYPSLNYEYTIEDTPLGTGGGIRKAIQLITEENVLIVNADTFFEVDIKALHSFHLSTNAHCTISLKQMYNFERYGCVELDNNSNTILSFKEKTFTTKGYINAGYLVINKNYFLSATNNLPQIFSFEKDFLEKNLAKMLIKGLAFDGYFIDIGIPEDFVLAQEKFKNI
ncbi:MAG TPA: nucleotidyltransferase family protein [Chitinophagaceae bacterium]|nr:nucleotidyltransferase family protein [Chitinophagaceae bacterium]MCC6634511.1 nucleotidyltransferase family protein [Chitinophagaceae bacterium]HMZ45685.1 nucleotidyltransferase family protein [Chitinophagaceae bacterium]HNF28769.1 nucleotidyltransferase family protein [Chitinophagaceae bacterium]HNJ58441.1 nucleotidyltransferase family protein [Chitinophagaceae bacterium]